MAARKNSKLGRSNGIEDPAKLVPELAETKKSAKRRSSRSSYSGEDERLSGGGASSGLPQKTSHKRRRT